MLNVVVIENRLIYNSQKIMSMMETGGLSRKDLLMDQYFKW